MHLRRSSTPRGIVLFLVVLGAAQLACVGGHIPPSMFQFENVVPYSPPEPGGWKAAQVVILLGRISPAFPQSATCDIEVGVPEMNKHGWVTDGAAQAAALPSEALWLPASNGNSPPGRRSPEFRSPPPHWKR
jgi:hypothetical protein